MRNAKAVEWPTIGLVVICYALWFTLSNLAGDSSSPLLWWMVIPALAALTTLQASLCHEALHGHPTRRAWVNEAMVGLAVGLFIPYRRFRTLHMRHHANARLTDPYDDPESFYLARRDWNELGRFTQALLRINNTLVGRLTVGPALALTAFYGSELKLMRAGDRQVAAGWLWHCAGLAPVLLWLSASGFPLWLYALTIAYPSYSLLMLRTYAEHQAHEDPAQQTAIIQATPVLALLFLNNNLHVAHHENPRAPWYRLPALCREGCVDAAYRFAGYGELFRRFAFSAKEPVPHPHLRRQV